MITLTEFLLAHIAEDEAAARAASEGGASWSQSDREREPGRVESAGYVVVYDEGSPTAFQAAHIARHDPARVLAECEAKRQIVELHSSADVSHVEWWDAPGMGMALICPACRPGDPTEGWDYDAAVKPDGFVPTYTLSPCPTLRALALPYADHADYRDEWKP